MLHCYLSWAAISCPPARNNISTSQSQDYCTQFHSSFESSLCAFIFLFSNNLAGMCTLLLVMSIPSLKCVKIHVCMHVFKILFVDIWSILRLQPTCIQHACKGVPLPAKPTALYLPVCHIQNSGPTRNARDTSPAPPKASTTVRSLGQLNTQDSMASSQGKFEYT